LASTSEIPIGERIRFYREAQRKTQAVVAGLAGITDDYLSQIERGLKTPTIALLHRIARILGVSTSALLGEPPPQSDDLGSPAIPTIHRALLGYGPPRADPGHTDLGDLRGRVDAAWTSWQTAPTRYSSTGPLLPDLILDVEQATRQFVGADELQERRESFRLAADLYFLLRTFCKRVGRLDLSLLVADRALRAAEAADDPLRMAAAKWNLGHVLLAANDPEGAEDVAARAAEELEPGRPEADPRFTALYGALQLVAAMAAVRNGDAWTARDRLREKARPAAERAGEGNVCWTVFGPTNVGLHEVSLEVEAGEAAEALRLADRVDASRSPSIERRATFLLELARCYEQRREDPAVLLHLLSAERQAPEDMRYNLLARDLVRGLVKRARPSYAVEARGLAGRIGLLAS
jgi:DNA-binding XRE family transcriptional regulator/tetratricopeptide (TPR) repeat protein